MLTDEDIVLYNQLLNGELFGDAMNAAIGGDGCILM